MCDLLQYTQAIYRDKEIKMLIISYFLFPAVNVDIITMSHFSSFWTSSLLFRVRVIFKTGVAWIVGFVRYRTLVRHSYSKLKKKKDSLKMIKKEKREKIGIADRTDTD